MNLLANVFLGTGLVAGILSLLAFIGWLLIQIIGNANYLFGRGDDDEDHRNRPR